MRYDDERFWRAVSTDGYEWIEATDINERLQDPKSEERVISRFLTDHQAVGVRSSSIRPYQPLIEFSGLFRMFAATDPTDEGIKRFADRFGPIGGAKDSHPIVLDQKGEQPLMSGETKEFWLKHMYPLKRLIELWDMIHYEDLAGLQSLIRWKSDSHVCYERCNYDETDKHNSVSVIASSNHNSYLLEDFDKDDLIGPAMIYVQQKTNQMMRSDISPFLVADKHPTDIKLSLFPTSLAGAMWLQFARSIEKRSDFKICGQCGDWFEVVRKGKEFCSNRCRTRAHRAKTAEN
jgi:hypothetical protein